MARGPSKVVLVPRSFHKSCYTVWCSTPGNRNLVLRRQSFRRVEVHWFPSLDSWQACVIHSLTTPLSDAYFLYSGLREECPLVRCLVLSLFGLLKLSVSSAVIQEIMTLRDAGLASMAYYYFDFRDTDKQNRRNLIISLLSQLSARSDLCCDILHRLYVTHDNGAHKPTDDVLIQCLKETLTFSGDRPIYIILDALDECPNTFGVPSPREVVLNFVKELVELSLTNLHICITSRPEIDIRTVIEPLTTRRVSLHDETGQKKDIAEYVSSVVRSDMQMSKWREEDQKLVIETLSERADGMCVSDFE